MTASLSPLGVQKNKAEGTLKPTSKKVYTILILMEDVFFFQFSMFDLILQSKVSVPAAGWHGGNEEGVWR